MLFSCLVVGTAPWFVPNLYEREVAREEALAGLILLSTIWPSTQAEMNAPSKGEKVWVKIK